MDAKNAGHALWPAQLVEKAKWKKKVHKNLVANHLRNQYLINAAQNAGGRPRQHLQHLTAWLVRGFDRVAVKRAPKLFERREAASFLASRRTGSIVYHLFLLPKCLCQSERVASLQVLLHPFLNAFPAGKAWETGVGPRGLSACSAFCRDQSNS